jgi:dsRNA-specific ribonuclease
MKLATTTQLEPKTYTLKSDGQRLNIAERTELIADMVESMLAGYQSDRQLSEDLKISRPTIGKYKQYALQLIASTKLDQPQIRALQLSRLYQDLENLTIELQAPDLTVKDKMSIYNQRSKINQQIALVSGLNIETKVNVDAKKLVITRAHPDAVRQAIEGEVVQLTDS